MHFPFQKIFKKKLKIKVDTAGVILYNNPCRSPKRLFRVGSIAQLGEHLPYKQRVTGSSPVVPTINSAR